MADVEKLDIRVGTINCVSEIKQSDKLLKLTVDFGGHVRSILSGMKKERDDPQEIVGLQALFILNLPDRKMAGEISQGMLFDIGDARKTGSQWRSGGKYLLRQRTRRIQRFHDRSSRRICYQQTVILVIRNSDRFGQAILLVQCPNGTMFDGKTEFRVASRSRIIFTAGFSRSECRPDPKAFRMLTCWPLDRGLKLLGVLFHPK